jgi:hypothetical protein
MQPVDSKKQKLGLTDLLSIVGEASDNGLDLRTFALKTVMLASRPDTEFMNLGNSVFIIVDGGNRVGNIIVYNADTNENFIENYSKALDAAYMLGFDEVFTDFQESFLPFYEGFFDVYGGDGFGSEIQLLEDNTYRALMRLGPDREGERDGQT